MMIVLRRVCLAACLLSLGLPALAQTDGYLHLNDEVHNFLERQQVLGNLDRAFLDEQPLSAARAHRYLDSLAALAERAPERFNANDRRRLAQLRGTEPRDGAKWVNRHLPPLYENNIDFFSVEEGPLRLQVQPKLYLSAGYATETSPFEEPRSFVYQNTRAARVSGRLGQRFYFHAQLEENQRIDPAVGRDLYRPRLPLAFQRDSTLFDYAVSEAAIGYQDRYLEVRFARDRQRWGFARNAMYLSNHAPAYTSLQARLEVWRLSFTTRYAVLDDASAPPPSGSQFPPTKHSFFHRVGLSLPGGVSVGIFEGIILAPDPDEIRFYNFIHFLNPLLFYNSVDRESDISPGNVMIGADLHWVAHPGIALYGQFILDDFEADKLFSEGGYWKNTWGLLGGVHLVDVGLPGLEVRAEHSRIRPYVYANFARSLAYTHREGYLGSPAGPNSHLSSFDITYRPTRRLETGLNTFLLHRGRSTGGLNYGDDPFVPFNENRVSDDEVHTLQGIRQTRHFVEGRVAYEVLLPSLWIEGVVRHEAFEDAEFGATSGTSFLIQLRWGMPPQHPLF